MRAHVLSQVPGHRKRLAARLAYMLPLPCMQTHVPSQAVRPREGLAARLTDMSFLNRILIRMRPHVPLQSTDR